MNRRNFIGKSVLLSGIIASVPTFSKSEKLKYHLKYSPKLDVLADVLTIEQRIEQYVENGFYSLEYSGLMNHSLQETENFKNLLSKYNIEFGTFLTTPDPKHTWLSDKNNHQLLIDRIKKASEYQKIIGNNFVTVLPGLIIPDVQKSVMITNASECLKRVAEIAEKNNFIICVEALSQKIIPGCLLSRTIDTIEVIKNVGSKNVKMLYDLFHQQTTEGNLISTINEYYDDIGYYQVGDAPTRMEPGTGEINFKNIFKNLYQKNYKGFIGMDHGLSVAGVDGLIKSFNAYKEADNF